MSTPTWRCTIDTKDTKITPGSTLTEWIVEGTGDPPKLEDLTPPTSPGDSADPPPVKPPIGDPLAPQPGEDTSPFPWPTDGPRYQTRDFDRNYPLDRDGTPGAKLYAAEGDAGNPLVHALSNAGFIAEGGRTSYGRVVGGLRLWAPTDTPPHLLRRALKQGHL